MAFTASLDKAEYTPGDAMILTVVTDAGERATIEKAPATVTVSVDGQDDVVVLGTVNRPGPSLAVRVSDDGSRTWTPLSDDGTTAVFRATA